MYQKARSLSRASRCLLLVYLYWLHFTERFPRLVFSRRIQPVKFALLTGLLMFVLLPILPFHPISLPLSFGAGLSAALIITSIRPALSAHWVGL
jgi:hypothetical protein